MEVLLQPGHDFPSELVREDSQTFGGSVSNDAEEQKNLVFCVMPALIIGGGCVWGLRLGVFS